MNLLDIINKEKQIIFKNIENKTFKNQTAKHMTIRSSIIVECIFDNVDFRNCDFICNKVCDSEFMKDSFVNADIFSTWFSNCTFQHVDFTGANIEDITFVKCKFDNCIFDGVSLKKCTFNYCNLININPKSCIFSLNDYSLCDFEKCSFLSSFQYQIFKKCKFVNVMISSSALQYNFGLGNISGIKYIHNNEINDCIIELKSLLISDCIDHRLFIEAVIVDYNFEDYINPELAIKSISALEQMLKNNLLLSNDELSYIKHLYHYFYENNLIAPIVFYKMFEMIKKICINQMDNIAYLKSKDSIYMIANGLFFDFNNFCEDLLESLKQIPAYEAPAYIKIHYVNEPTLSLVDLLNQCIPGIKRRVKTMQGSYIEFLEIGQNGLELFNIFLQILGISIPIIYSEIQKKKTSKKVTKNSSKKVNIEINTLLSQNEREASNLIQQTCQVTITSDVLNVNLQGFNNDNIKDIKIEIQV